MIYWLTTNLWTTGPGRRDAPPHAEARRARRSARAVRRRRTTPARRATASQPIDGAPRPSTSSGRRAAQGQAKARREDRAVSESTAVTVEATGETVGEAKWAALRELEQLVPGLDRESVQFQVVSEGERGLLGVGFTPAHVIAERGLAPSRRRTGDESAKLRRPREFVERVAAGIGADVSASRRGARRRGHRDLLGRRSRRSSSGSTARRSTRSSTSRTRSPAPQGGTHEVVVDAAGYRARRTATLETLARRTAQRASATGRACRAGADDCGRAQDRPRGAEGRSRGRDGERGYRSRTASWSSSRGSSQAEWPQAVLERWLEEVLATPGATALTTLRRRTSRPARRRAAARPRPRAARRPGRRRRLGRRLAGYPAGRRAARTAGSTLLEAERRKCELPRAIRRASFRTSRSSGDERRSSRWTRTASRSRRRSRSRPWPRSSASRSSSPAVRPSSGSARPPTGTPSRGRAPPRRRLRERGGRARRAAQDPPDTGRVSRVGPVWRRSGLSPRGSATRCGGGCR